jgi:hypothetical protein
VVVVAAGAVAVVVFWALPDREKVDTSPPTLVAAPSNPQPPEPVTAVPPAPPAEAPVAEAPPVAEVVDPAPAEPVTGEELSEKVKDFLGTLTDGEREALFLELSRQRMARWREDQKYRLPSDMKLMALRWHERGAYQLDEGQKAEIARLSEAMRPRVEAALSSYWQREEALREEIAELHRQKRYEDAKPVYQQYGELNQQMAQARQQVDEEYKQWLRTVLTPDQMSFVESDNAVRIRSMAGQQR